MLVTLLTSHPDISPLKGCYMEHGTHVSNTSDIPSRDIPILGAIKNMALILVTLLTFHLLISSLNFLGCENNSFILVTIDVFHLLICPYFTDAFTGFLHHSSTAFLISSSSVLCAYSASLI